MMFKANNLCLISTIVMLLAAPDQMAADTADVQQFNNGLEAFGSRLFAQLLEDRPQENVVFSPFSIQLSLTMARMGAEGQTADEMDKALALSGQNPNDLARNYHAILEKYENDSILKIANKIYAMEGYAIQENYNNLLKKQFYSSVESVDFANNVPAARAINSWVEEKTNHLIKDLIDSSKLDAFTRVVLVNAIYFKGNWTHKFQKKLTRERDFYLDDVRTAKVQMMHIKEDFKYADLPDLDAQALLMPYENSNLSMLIILPNKRTGLAELQKKLQTTSLSSITEQMFFEEVIVDLPKFKVEFEVELKKPLSKLGMERMFTENAEFGKMLKSDEDLQISSVVHKAFIEVNESGTEAAAATAMGIMMCSMPLFEAIPKRFNANRPFYYVLISRQQLVIFQGNIQHL